MKPIKTIEKYLSLLEKKKALDEEIEIARQQTMDQLQSLGVKQLKLNNVTVTVAKRVTETVDELGFEHWADQQPDFEADLFYVNMLDKKKVVMFSKKHLKETGEIVPFISANETEYLMVRPVKETGQDE